METAKVDIRKLQLLNDRINQTIEALNQVRMSVHGIGHSVGYAQQMSPFGMGMPQQPMQSMGYGTTAGFPGPYGLQGQFPGTPWGGMGGLAHTGGWQTGSHGWTGVGQTGFGPSFGTTGYGSSVEGYQVDPQQVFARVAHTFPYAFLPQSPFGPTV